MCRTLIVIGSIILFPILSFLYFTYLFGLALDDHYDIKKGTFLWYATINEVITEFPVIEPDGEVTYHHIGGDSPGIAGGSGIVYESRESSKKVIPLLKDYLLKEGYTLEIVNKTKCGWAKDFRNNTTLLFAGISKEGGCLDLTLEIKSNGNSEIEALILY